MNAQKLKCYAHKVLPLVYDSSLSYYEVLAKVVSKLNEVIDNENEEIAELARLTRLTNQHSEAISDISSDITDINNSLEQLKEYIDNEIDNVVSQFNAKLKVPTNFAGNPTVGYALAVGADNHFTWIKIPTKTSDLENDSGFITEFTIQSEPVVKDVNILTDANSGTLQLKKINLVSSESETITKNIQLADGTKAGLMTPENVNAIENLITIVSGLQGRTVRLLYSAGANPTPTQIKNFVISQGYTDETTWASIAVIISANYHIWRSYTQTEDGETVYLWRDFGVDTVTQATLTQLGIVLSSSSAGQIFVESDGKMSLNGYSDIISNLQNKIDLQNIQHETWTFTLEDNTTVTKEVVLWTSQE